MEKKKDTTDKRTWSGLGWTTLALAGRTSGARFTQKVKHGQQVKQMRSLISSRAPPEKKFQPLREGPLRSVGREREGADTCTCPGNGTPKKGSRIWGKMAKVGKLCCLEKWHHRPSRMAPTRKTPGFFFISCCSCPKKKLLFRSSDTTKRVARKLSGKLKVTSRGHITDATAAEGTRRELRA